MCVFVVLKASTVTVTAPPPPLLPPQVSPVAVACAVGAVIARLADTRQLSLPDAESRLEIIDML